MTHHNPNSPASEIMEFHAEDDAWYSVRLVFSGNTLIVKYCNFPESCDERFSANSFKSVQDVEKFGERFRPASVQLQDSECRKVIQGVMVCASISFQREDVRFYDACVEEVEHKEHSFAKGEEECMCEFMLFWQHGPKAGQLTLANVENICLIQPCALNSQTITDFLMQSRDRVKNRSANASLISNDNGCKNNANQKSIHSPYFSLRSMPKEINYTNQSETIIEVSEGSSPYVVRRSMCGELTREDTDLGGEACFMKKPKETAKLHFLLINNLEKDLSQSTLVEFIHKQTNVSTVAFVFPCLLSETYSRGILVVNCKEKLEKLRLFLGNPDHLIVSSRGRPWVISEIDSVPDSFEISMATMMLNSQNKTSKGNSGNSNELKIARSGSEEYTTAMKVKNLVTNFLDHQKRMHAKLDFEVKKILNDRK